MAGDAGGRGQEAGKGGEKGGGGTFHVLGSVKNLRRGPGGGQGGEMGGGTKEQCGQQGVHWFHLLGSLKNLTIGLIWLVTRGQAWGGWATGKGGRWGGGHQRVVWEQQGVQQGVHWFHLLGSLKNLTIGLIWLVTRRVGQGGGQGGGDGGSREVGGEVERVDKMWRPLKGEPAGRRPQGSAD